MIYKRLEKFNDPEAQKQNEGKSNWNHRTATESIKEVQRLDKVTKNYSKHFLNIAIAYGGQNEL